jgi:hypothetical protein
VTTPAPAITLDDAKRHLNITTAVDDDELTDFIDRAVTRLTHEVGPLSPTEVTERHNGPGAIVLRQLPVLAVTSVDNAGTPVTEPDVDLETGIIYASGLSRRQRSVTVTYTAGFDPLPADLRHAALELLRHLWATQRGNTPGGARAGLLGTEGADPTTAAGMQSYSLPYRVLEMIRPYQRTGVVA